MTISCADKYYKPQYWWYETVELSRRLAVSCVLFFFEPGKPVQIVVAQLSVVIYLVFTAFNQPYAGSHNSSFSVFTQWQLTLTLSMCVDGNERVCMCVHLSDAVVVVFCRGLLLKLEIPIVGTIYDMEAEHEAGGRGGM
jgi:hypothetical protein